MKKSCLKGCFCSKEVFVNKDNCHCKLEEAARRVSSTQVVYEQQQQASKILDQVQDDSIIRTTKAFTLIELLVVVLIIGILAAVAVPQYQKAVTKTRVVEAISMLKALQQAQEAYYLANNEYTDNISQLDIDIPTEQKASSWSGVDAQHATRYMYSCHSNGFCAANASDDNLPLLQEFAPSFSGAQMRGRILCAAYRKSEQAEKICQSMGPVNHEYEDPYGTTKYYEIH